MTVKNQLKFRYGSDPSGRQQKCGDGFTGDLVAKLQQVGARVGVGEADAHRGLQEHQVGLCMHLV